MDIVIAVADKTLPRDSAINILQVAYKLTPEEAAAVVGAKTGEGFDAKKAEEEKEENKDQLPDEMKTQMGEPPNPNPEDKENKDEENRETEEELDGNPKPPEEETE